VAPGRVALSCGNRNFGRFFFLSTRLQFFGHVAIDGATEVMTVTLKDAADTALWSRQIEPQAA
jgi:hypothetical protein